jgi:hypothetical protein
MLREHLDATDRHIHTLLQRRDATDRVVADAPPAAREILATLADIAAHVGQGEGDRGMGT